MNKNRTTTCRVRDMVYIGLSAAMICICAWMSIPLPSGIPVSLQTFAVFASVGLLGTYRAIAAVTVYLILGSLGVPVFSGFRGGVDMLVGTTGGYLLGLLAAVLVSGGLIRVTSRIHGGDIISMFCGQLVCYVSGGIWYVFVYAPSETGLAVSLLVTTIPFLLPDVLKIFLASSVSKRCKRFIDIANTK